MSKISVIIPAYNAEETILNTVKSVLDQTYEDLEIIVINDGSSDRTVAVLETISDQRVDIYSFSNSGVSVARNRGIDLATGDYISFLDADDRWTTDKLAVQLAALQDNPHAALAYSWVYFQYARESKSYEDTSVNFSGNVYPDLLLKNFLQNGSNALIRTAVIKEIGYFDAELKAAEDWEYYLRIAAKYQFILVPQVQVIYQQADNSLSANIKLMEHYLQIVIDRAFVAAPKELQYLKKQTRSCVHRYLAQQYIKYQLHNFKGIKLAALNLGRAILVYPAAVLEPFTQYLCKQLIKKTYKQIINY